jgi:uncharacterized protein (DUF849 family)
LASHQRGPTLLAVAPNGARRGSADHPALPVTVAAIARAADECRKAGAAMIHLHVRDGEGRHTLDPEVYRAAIARIRAEAGDRIVVQISTEAVGRYRPAEQMATVRAVKPEAVSLALREIAPDEAAVPAAAAFLAWLHRERILPQFILYSPKEVAAFEALLDRGVIPPDGHSVLYVLGRYAADQESRPADLLPFLAAGRQRRAWSVCAFGPQETACAVAAAALGGHARVGFENNLHLPDGGVAPDNAALVGTTAAAMRAIGCRLADADEARAILAGGWA